MATDLLKDKTSKVLTSMSVPISLGMLSTFLFQVIDTYFVGKLGPDALAALSFSSTVYFLVVGLFMGLSVGVSIIIGTAKGAGNTEKVNQTSLIALLLSFLLALFLSGAMIYYVEPIFITMGASSTVLPLVKLYIAPIFYGMPLLTIGLMAGGILRATGNVKKPEIVMGLAGVVNLVLDYALIFGAYGFPEMGISGAAWATFSSWVFVIIGMLVLLVKDRLLKVSLTALLSKGIATIKEIFTLGLPTIVTQIVGPLTTTFLVFLFAKQNSEAVAAYGVASRIEMLLLIGILGVSTAITPFIAQNLGAKATQRIDESIAYGGRASTYLGALICLLLFLFIKPIAAIFSDDIIVVDTTATYFYWVSISYIFYGLFIITSSIFNGLKLPVNSLKIMVQKSLLFTVPLSFIGSFFGVEGIFIGISVSNILGGLLATYYIRKHFKEIGSPMASVNIWHEYANDIKSLFGIK